MPVEGVWPANKINICGHLQAKNSGQQQHEFVRLTVLKT